MDIVFNCPNCEQQLEVDAAGSGSEIECPACGKSIVIPAVENARLSESKPLPATMAGGPPKDEKHFIVPVHEHAPESLIRKSTARTLDVIAKEGDKKMRIKTIRRNECQEVGKDHFDERVSEFLDQVGQINIVSVSPITYSYMELSTRQFMTDYGVLIVFKG